MAVYFQQLSQDTLSCSGELSRDDLAVFEAGMTALMASSVPLVMDMHALDIIDGMAVVAAVDGLRRLAAARQRLEIHGAPQVLGHNLYRVAALGPDSPIVLVAMREDEPYG